MSLTVDEKETMRTEIAGRACDNCGASDDFAIEDAGYAYTEWCVRGAYVRCDACGHELFARVPD